MVAISGKNARRVLHGALNVTTGELVRVVRTRSLTVWGTAPPHHSRLACETAEAPGTALVPLPFRAPELMPCADVWREMKRTVAANRVYADGDGLTQRGVGWLDARTPAGRLRIAGLRSSKFEWLPT